MKFRILSSLLIVVAAAVLLGVLGLAWARQAQPVLSPKQTTLRVQVRQSTNQEREDGAQPTPQVVMGTPETYTPTATPARYTYRNEFPEDRSKRLPLYLIDTETGEETRLGDDSAAASFGAMDDRYLVWYSRGTHLYDLATGQDLLLSRVTGSLPYTQLTDDWLIFGRYRGGGSPTATLYAAHIQSQEVITLTQILPAADAFVGGYFGISDRLAAWYEARNTVVVYDLISRHEIARLTDINTVFDERYLDVYALSPGETVVTWSRGYGYDLVTHSYFRLGSLAPPDWDGALISDISRIQEENRILTWYFKMKDGSQRHIRAPLLDATPSTAPCIANQNLVQNGDLESVADHALWQQSGSTTNLLVNDPPPGLATGGQWAIRLGRFNNAQQAIHQTVGIPSGVKGLTLTFAVRAHSWDLWGGDRLQLDLVDPLSGQSLLATPVQWTNVQLASGDWIPMQVAIQNWPGIDTPLHLVFRTQTDWAFPTDFTVDNIQLTTTCVRQ